MHNPYSAPASAMFLSRPDHRGEARQALLLTGVLVSLFIMFYVGRMGPTPYLTSSPNYVRPRQTVR